MENNSLPPYQQISDADSFASNFLQLLSSNFFINLVTVKAVRGDAPNLVVDVLPLVAGTDNSGSLIQPSQIYNIPVWRLQRGSSAIIMNPIVGDIGMIAVCDRDTTVARTSRKASVPGSKRMHSNSDAVYLGGLLNEQPSQYVEFADGAINIVTPNPVNVQCSTANITAPDGVNMTTPLLKVSGSIQAGGDITDNSESQAATVKTLRDNYNTHTHAVPGVETGPSTVTSNQTSAPT